MSQKCRNRQEVDGPIDLSFCKTERQRERIAMLNECGGNVYHAAERLGIHPQCIYDILHRFRLRGLIDKRPTCPLEKALRDRVITLGGLNGTMRRQDRAVRAWVADNTPEGGSVADLAWAIFADLAAEEGYNDDDEETA